MNIKPLYDKVVLKQLEAEQKTASGIYIPDAAKEKPESGEVLAVGKGKKDGDKVTPLEVKVGDKVIYSKYSGTKIKYEGVEYLIVSESDILAILG